MSPNQGLFFFFLVGRHVLANGCGKLLVRYGL